MRTRAAGIDIGARESWVSVLPSASKTPVQSFGVWTPELHKLAEWLASGQVTTVAMESTRVYWVPLFEILEEQGFEV